MALAPAAAELALLSSNHAVPFPATLNYVGLAPAPKLRPHGDGIRGGAANRVQVRRPALPLVAAAADAGPAVAEPSVASGPLQGLAAGTAAALAQVGVSAPPAAARAAEEYSAQEIMELEAKLLVRTYARAPVVLTRGSGCKVYDVEGKEYLDMSGGIAVNALGHSDSLWVEAVAKQAGILAHTSNLYHTVPQVMLAQRLVGSSFADRCFFANSGTEANEAAIKFARKFQRSRAGPDARWLKLGPPPVATGFVAFSAGFHGRTLGALSLTSKPQYRAPFEPLMPGVEFAPYGDLEAAARAIKKGATAGVFVEPLQGEGGVHAATADFLRGLRRLCDDAGALLIFDEVQCGLGRTGRLWAHEPYGVAPDIMTLAKPLAGGLPIGAVLVTEAVASAISFGDHGSTFAGGPLVCHAALAVLDRLQGPGFLEGVAAKGERVRAALRAALGGSRHVREVRGVGLLVGVQLACPAGPWVDAARERGLLVITAGKGDVLRLAPPLVVTEEELDHCVAVLADTISALG